MTTNISIPYFKEASEDVKKEMARRLQVNQLYSTGTTGDSGFNWEAFGFVIILLSGVGLFVCVCAGLCALARRFLGNRRTQGYNVARAERAVRNQLRQSKKQHSGSEKSASRLSLTPSGKGSEADADTANNDRPKTDAKSVDRLKNPPSVVSGSSRSLAPSGKGSEADADTITNNAADQAGNNAAEIANAAANVHHAVNFPEPVADNAEVIIDFGHGHVNLWFHLEPEDDNYQGPDPDAAFYHRDAWRQV